MGLVMALRKQFEFGVIIALVLGLRGGADAQTYPKKSVTFIAPFAAGGSVDPVARMIGERMGEIMHQPVVVLNRPGAGGNIGAESVARAAPDGYTLLIGSTALAISPSLYPKLSYDWPRTSRPSASWSRRRTSWWCIPSIPVRSVVDLIALARSKPDQLRSASAGVGTSNHLALVLFNAMAGVSIAHIPYKGASPAVSDVLAGHVDMTFVPIPAAVSFIEFGQLRALAVTSATRSSIMPKLPTVAEAGVAGYEASSWVGLLAPAATPPPWSRGCTRRWWKRCGPPNSRKRWRRPARNRSATRRRNSLRCCASKRRSGARSSNRRESSPNDSGRFDQRKRNGQWVQPKASRKSVMST